MQTIGGGYEKTVVHSQYEEGVEVLSFAEYYMFFLCETDLLGWRKPWR